MIIVIFALLGGLLAMQVLIEETRDSGDRTEVVLWEFLKSMMILMIVGIVFIEMVLKK